MVGAMLVGLDACLMVMVDDGVPSVAGHGVLTVAGLLVLVVVAGSGLALASRTGTRRLGIGLLVGTTVVLVLFWVAWFVALLIVAARLGS